ncbi:TIGR03032 family protein [Magnetofaba australis]|nr:TIGR03032 family protein [Magnetofaba australis]
MSQSDATPLPNTEPATPPLSVRASPGFAAWMAQQGVGLAFTTYQSGKLFLLGGSADGRLSVFERTFEHCMGLCAHNDSLVMSSKWQIWRFDNVLTPDQNHNGYDRLYLPTQAYTTGNVDTHDIGVDAQGRILFVNTLFNCLSAAAPGYSFVPLWRPPFVSGFAAEDRCHLNGMALRDGAPRYVTMVANSDHRDGWRDHRADGGLLMDITTNQILLDGLSMPHSPRVYDGHIWLLNSGRGELQRIPLTGGAGESVAPLPGYGRGLTFVGRHAVVGLSKARRDKAFSGLPLDDILAQRGTPPQCGLAVIDIDRGQMAHQLLIEGVVSELYDVIALPGARRPMAVGLLSDEIHHILRIGAEAPQNGPF